MAWRSILSRSVKEICFLFCQSSPANGPSRYHPPPRFTPPPPPTTRLFSPLPLKLVPLSCLSVGFRDLIRREFMKKIYGDIKTRNPSLPVLISECSGVEAQLWARYGCGSLLTRGATSLKIDHLWTSEALANDDLLDSLRET